MGTDNKSVGVVRCFLVAPLLSDDVVLKLTKFCWSLFIFAPRVHSHNGIVSNDARILHVEIKVKFA